MNTQSQKGIKGGHCNREACQRPGATYYNASTQRWYCPDCARAINRWSLHDDGVVLCTLGKPQDDA